MHYSLALSYTNTIDDLIQAQKYSLLPPGKVTARIWDISHWLCLRLKLTVYIYIYIYKVLFCFSSSDMYISAVVHSKKVSW